MKTIQILVGLILLLGTSLLAETNAPSAVSPAVVAARTEGTRLAQADFTNGVYRLQTYGFMSGKMNPGEEYLRKNYSVDIWPVAACIVSEDLRAKAEAYNSEMKRLLVKKLGKDIFEEAKKATSDR